MKLHVLPDRSAGAAANMAADFLMLQRYPGTDLRVRHYGWHRPAFTFGYGQKMEFVRSHLPPNERVELCRRPTGGGLVDHRFDWTYALVIPRGHAAYDARAVESYRVVHTCLCAALVAHGQDALLKEHGEPGASDAPCAAGICFTRAERYDVVAPVSETKIAGAAQKRNKMGLLFQGSVSRAAVRADLPWEAFHQAFVAQLGERLGCDVQETSWPDFNEDEFDGLVEQYSTSEWNGFR